MPTTLNGKSLAQEILADLKRKIAGLALKRPLRLVAVLVGDDAGSLAFLKQKEKAAEELGVDFEVKKFPADISNEKLRKAIVELGRKQVVSGMIVQLPLPAHLNTQTVLNAIPTEKDVDVLTERNIGRFVLGRLPFDPPPVAGIKRLLEKYALGIAGKEIAVVGQGRLIGRPVCWWLLQERVSFAVLDIGTPDIAATTQRADIIITGVGRSRLITGDMIKEGAVIFDFGFAKDGEAIVGDVDFEAVAQKASHITPVPGGMGPLTVAMLFENLYTLYGARR